MRGVHFMPAAVRGVHLWRALPPRAPGLRPDLAALRALQRTAGNRAVVTAVAAGSLPVPVQRCGSERHAGCPCVDAIDDSAVQAVQRVVQPPGSPQRKVDERSFARLGGKIEEVGDTTGGGAGDGKAESNEFLLWNYEVGKPDLRTGHRTYLTGKVLAPGRWPDMLRADPGLRVAVVGGASSTGSAAVSDPLAVARADQVKTALAAGGVDTARIVTSSVGIRHAFADETSSENMARNRRVEVYLFRPTHRATAPSSVAIRVTSLSAAVPAAADRDTSDPGRLNLRWHPFVFTAEVTATGPPTMTVGILQFLRGDSRVGSYRSGRGNFVLDFGRCMQPDLPCKDVAESMGVFSGTGRLTGTGSGTVSMSDAPGISMPIRVRDPRIGTLESTHWEMEFVAVLGARLADSFIPVKSVVWRLVGEHELSPSGTLKETLIDAKADPPQNSAPADLDIEQAMDGRTCRFMARRMNNFCRPELAMG
jgi:hypothetical protein